MHSIENRFLISPENALHAGVFKKELAGNFTDCDSEGVKVPPLKTRSYLKFQAWVKYRFTSCASRQEFHLSNFCLYGSFDFISFPLFFPQRDVFTQWKIRQPEICDLITGVSSRYDLCGWPSVKYGGNHMIRIQTEVPREKIITNARQESIDNGHTEKSSMHY